jgi:hypothetical protein
MEALVAAVKQAIMHCCLQARPTLPHGTTCVSCVRWEHTQYWCTGGPYVAVEEARRCPYANAHVVTCRYGAASAYLCFTVFRSRVLSAEW